ncbi:MULTISPECIES: GH25 family lysozyme [Curtobacterium]|uniref:GH25 family lysozyme n=1 Tax=Curtobacterium TaxID=2034 RepID=UPI000AE17F56|nr:MULTISPECIES: GH25 family lysozyme [Curtobacterium]MBT1618903.1 lysozyme [Curtobacterium flaccumfaciens pv. poinsettiae]MCU0153552.1 GH25 family lysozyme [Curtobacterium flaccumfaciens pv. poinsettiae]UXN14516.1 GH25 family lysozyme [Curtobacterium flaccumfaciens pv. poinsettiae]
MRAPISRLLGLGTAAVVAGAITFASGPAVGVTTTAPATAAPAPTAGTSAAAPAAEAPTEQLSIAEMDRTGNHTMGAGIAAHAGESHVTTASPDALSGGVSAQALSSSAAAASAGGPPPGRVQGFDISAWQPSVNFRQAYGNGARFVYVKATEGTSYVSSTYKQQYATAKQRNLYRGGYVYAQPSQASGAATANYFFAHGGQWSKDGKTLPPLLDIEYGSAAQGTCYGKSWSSMRSWIKDFNRTVVAKTGRYPAIYTTTDWWKRCTNNSNQFSKNPLFVAIYPVKDFTTPGTLGRSWSKWTFWQWASSGTLPGDQDVYRNDITYLKRFASRTS